MANPNASKNRARVVYFSHGGGPLPILGDKGHKAMVDFMKDLPSRLGRPEAILVISAHWEEREATLLGGSAPQMLYDYYGFPQESYDIVYPAPGFPALADRIAGILGRNGIASQIDTQRGFDHGLFIPLMLMYPQADIPSLQLSLINRLRPDEHLALGRALGELMDENILVIGSGFSFHNLRAFSWGEEFPPDPRNDAFQEWLVHVCTGPLSLEERKRSLIEWENAPHARYCHPREEHLLPLHVCLGMAGGGAETIFDDYILGKRSVAFLWT